MIFLETNAGMTLERSDDVRQMLPINFWPNNPGQLDRNLSAIVNANQGVADLAVTFDSHFIERHLGQNVPADAREPYISPEQCAWNYAACINGEIPLRADGFWHEDILSQLRIVRDTLGRDGRSVKWVWCRPEGSLWYEGPDPAEAARWASVRSLLQGMGIGTHATTKAEWRKITHDAFRALLAETLAMLGWAKDDDLRYWMPNFHDDVGIHIDDMNNAIPPVVLEPHEQWADLYVYPPEKGDTQKARVSAFCRRYRMSGVLHVRACTFNIGQPNQDIIPIEHVIDYCKLAKSFGSHIAVFCGNSPKEPFVGSPWTVDQAVKYLLENI